MENPGDLVPEFMLCNNPGRLFLKERLAVVILLIIFCLVMGTLTSLTARHEVLHVGESWMGLHLLGVAVTSLTVMVPLGAYLLFVFPTWSTLYFIAPASLSFWYILGLLLALPLAGALGYVVGISMCRWFGLFASIAVFVLFLSGMIAVIFFFSGELFHVSEGVQWKDAPSVFSGDLVAIFAFSFPIMLGAWLFIFTLYEVEGRKVVRASTTGALSPLSPDPSFSPPISVMAPGNTNNGFVVPDLASDKEGEEKLSKSASPVSVSNKEQEKSSLSPAGPEKV